MKKVIHLKTLFLRLVENTVRSGKKYERKNLEVFACDCKVSSVIPELAKLKFMGEMSKKCSQFFNKEYARTVPNYVSLGKGKFVNL